MSIPGIAVAGPRAAATPKQPIRSLTGLRFLAALHVVVYHLWINLRADFRGLPAWALNLCTSGYLGVPLFFLLSGFVMAITYLDAPPGQGMAIDARRYWVARIARIYPVYLLSLILSAPYFLAYKMATYHGLAGALKAGANVVLHGLLLQSWYPKLMLDINPPAWSLSVEAFFYAAFPLLGALGLTRLDRSGLRRAAVGLWLLSLGLSLAAFYLARTLPGADPGQIGGFRCVFPLLRLPDFLLGIAMGRLFLLGKRQQGGSHGMWTLAAAAAILVGMALTPEASDHNLASSLMLAPFALLVHGLAQGGAWLGRILSRPLPVLLGEASYSLYILHWPLLFVLLQVLSRLEELPLICCPLFYQPAFIVLAIAASLASYRYLEAPGRERIKRALG